jgi:prepilin-type N-terminal cleavage/methylation domain-containing protein
VARRQKKTSTFLVVYYTSEHPVHCFLCVTPLRRNHAATQFADNNLTETPRLCLEYRNLPWMELVMPSKGLTLLELLVTLSIAAIFMAVAAPSFDDLINRNCLRAAAYDLLTDIQKTRSEAFNRASRVTLKNDDDD